VSNLEKELRTQLFIRRRARGLTLTPAGERLLQQARDLLNHVSKVTEEARGGGRELSGPVSLGCFVTLAPLYLPPLLTAVAQTHPGIKVRVLEGEAGEIATALLAGRIDFALAYDLGFDDEEIVREAVASAPAHVIVSRGHRLAGRGSVDLAELADDPLILLDLPHSREYFWSVLASAGLNPVIRYRVRSYETVRSLVAQGHGFAVLNQVPLTAQTYSGGDVVALAIRGMSRPLDIVLAQLSGVRQTARAGAILGIARKAVAQTAAGHRIGAARTEAEHPRSTWP
jgi:DNA-binding transcriptional LysR family regulator